MEWTFQGDGTLEADVDVAAGDIEIELSSDGRVRVEAEPRGSGARRAEELLERVEVRLEGNRLRVHLPSRSFGSLRGVEWHCRISMPAGSALELRTASADLRCLVPLASFDGRTASGDVTLGDTAGDASLDSASGDLTCGDVGGDLRVRSASGDVEASRVAGEVRFATASGDLRVHDACSSVEVTSASGDVDLLRVRSGRVSVKTASGDLAVAVAAGTPAYLDASSASGEMTCDLPMQDDLPTSATLEIWARSASGDVRVTTASR